MASEVRIGVIGLGGMGGYHARYLLEGKIKRAKLGAVCDVDPSAFAKFPDVKNYTDSAKLIRSGDVDAVIIATPHYYHTTIGIDALEQGLHVLTEKPLSVHKADCARLIAAHKNPKQVFAIMFQSRTNSLYKKVKKIVSDGELGEIRRVIWIVTDWFRSEAYYASGGWRATWRGEGGGVLINQCPHNLDVLQWVCGMPARIFARVTFGKYHAIEVEDDVTAYLEYPNGATGVFIATTGEAPGTNRWEIHGERGRLVVERGKISFQRTEIPVTEYSRTTKEIWSQPPQWNIEIPHAGEGGAHENITRDFVEAILDGKPLIVRAEEGINSVEIANSIIHSSLTGRMVDLPLDAEAYEKQLKDLIANSKFEKKAVAGGESDITASFK